MGHRILRARLYDLALDLCHTRLCRGDLCRRVRRLRLRQLLPLGLERALGLGHLVRVIAVRARDRALGRPRAEHGQRSLLGHNLLLYALQGQLEIGGVEEDQRRAHGDAVARLDQDFYDLAARLVAERRSSGWDQLAGHRNDRHVVRGQGWRRRRLCATLAACEHQRDQEHDPERSFHCTSLLTQLTAPL